MTTATSLILVALLLSRASKKESCCEEVYCTIAVPDLGNVVLFQVFNYLVNILSSFSAVYEVLGRVMLPAKSDYTFREIPVSVAVSSSLTLTQKQGH